MKTGKTTCIISYTWMDPLNVKQMQCLKCLDNRNSYVCQILKPRCWPFPPARCGAFYFPIYARVFFIYTHLYVECYKHKIRSDQNIVEQFNNNFNGSKIAHSNAHRRAESFSGMLTSQRIGMAGGTTVFPLLTPLKSVHQTIFGLKIPIYSIIGLNGKSKYVHI